MILYKELDKMNLSKLSNEALLNDYKRFKRDKNIEPLLIQEIFRRTQNINILEKEDHNSTWYLKLYPNHWEVWRMIDNPFNSTHPTEMKGNYPVSEAAIFNTGIKPNALVKLYTIRGKIQNLMDELVEIRSEVAEHPEKRFSLFPDFHTVMKELERLDPFNPELDKGIMGKSIFGALIDA